MFIYYNFCFNELKISGKLPRCYSTGPPGKEGRGKRMRIKQKSRGHAGKNLRKKKVNKSHLSSSVLLSRLRSCKSLFKSEQIDPNKSKT